MRMGIFAFQFQIGNVPRQILTILDKPLHAFAEAGQFGDDFLFEHFDGQQRNDSDHGPHLQWNRRSFGVQLIVIEAVLVVPKAAAAEAIDGIGNGHEMLEKLRSHIFISGIALSQLEGNGQHRVAIKGHPGCAIGLLQKAACGQRLGAVEHTYVVQTQKAAGEKILAANVLAVDPPGEIEEQLLKDPRQVEPVTRAFAARDLVNAPCRPGVNRRVHVGKLEFVCG